MEPNEQGPKKNASVRQLLRQQRELQEKRKFGLAPLAVDTETHQEISPNIPEFISRAPWYYGASGPTLAHQRKQDDQTAGTSDEVLSDTADRIVVKGQASRFTVGACKNCGSRTHKTNECFQARKKVGSVYTNVVTGVDMETQQGTKTYAQKRDRFVGEVGVDLMRGVRPDGESAEETTADTSQPPNTRHRPDDVFGTRTAQHGGVEVKELPKYLHNLEQHDGLFFDPKTGSMRANPNAADSANSFQGDLEKYRSGDYYNYVESQHRFLTGQSRSFVDFEFDEAMRRTREEETRLSRVGGDSAETAESAPETAQDVLLRSLYGTSRKKESKVETVTAHVFDEAQHTSETASATPPAPPPSVAPHPWTEQEAVASVKAAAGGSAIQAAAVSWVPTRNGHAAVYGSFFDPMTFRWGYACCKATEKDAPGHAHA